ncbi:MAG: hypothetical protein AAB779_00380 [Patescibacteria group bacterium]
MYELKQIGVGSSARVSSFVFAVLYLIFSLIGVLSGVPVLQPANGAITIGIGFILTIAIGAVTGMIVAGVYNLLAQSWGGLHLDFHLLDWDDDMDSPVHHDSHPKK